MGLRRTARRLYSDYRLWSDAKMSGQRLEGERVVAGMATMPSRERTFSASFSSIIRQVDRLYLYLDGHETVPEIAQNNPRVVPIFAHEYPGLHANGKLLGLVLEQEPCLYACLDDDLHFSRNYIVNLRRALSRYDDAAVVGLHGTILARPLMDYYVDRIGQGNYARKWSEDSKVDLLGTGAALFSSSAVNVDVREWPRVSMTDLGLAIAAAKANLPMYSIGREQNLTFSLDRNQTDSLLQSRLKDSSRQTALGRELIDLRDRPQA